MFRAHTNLEINQTDLKNSTKLTVSKNGQKFILEKKFTAQTPIIFAYLCGVSVTKYFFETKNN